jgi:hypothetical protein
MAAGNTGDDFHLRKGLGQRRMLGLRLTPVSGQNGVQFTAGSTGACNRHRDRFSADTRLAVLECCHLSLLGALLDCLITAC